MTFCEVCGEWGQHPTAEHHEADPAAWIAERAAERTRWRTSTAPTGAGGETP